MKRMMKVTICTILIILGIIGSYSIINNTMSQPNDMGNGQMNQIPGNNGTIPENPDGNNTSNGTATQSPGNNSAPGPSTQGGTPPTGGNNGSTLRIIDYLQLFICNLVIAINIIFLLMTRTGKISLQEALNNKNYKIFFIVAIILLTMFLLGFTLLIAAQITPTNTG